MTGCDEERERFRQSIAMRITRMTDAQREEAKRLQQAYAQRRRDYLTRLYGKYPYDEPETARAEANPDEAHFTSPEIKLLV